MFAMLTGRWSVSWDNAWCFIQIVASGLKIWIRGWKFFIENSLKLCREFMQSSRQFYTPILLNLYIRVLIICRICEKFIWTFFSISHSFKITVAFKLIYTRCFRKNCTPSNFEVTAVLNVKWQSILRFRLYLLPTALYQNKEK